MLLCSLSSTDQNVAVAQVRVEHGAKETAKVGGNDPGKNKSPFPLLHTHALASSLPQNKTHTCTHTFPPPQTQYTHAVRCFPEEESQAEIHHCCHSHWDSSGDRGCGYHSHCSVRAPNPKPRQQLELLHMWSIPIGTLFYFDFCLRIQIINSKLSWNVSAHNSVLYWIFDH